MFREKLSKEIREVETILQSSGLPSQRVQVHIYCIAALLRRVMMRLTQFKSFKISVYEVPDRNFPKLTPKGNQQQAGYRNVGEVEIQLQTLVNRILHYSKFLPATGNGPTIKIKEFITILSDKDKCLRRREIAIENFIGIAKQIAEDDEAVITSLLQHTKKCLGKVVNSSSEDKFNESETEDALMDFFELAAKTKKDNWPEGKITLFHEKMKGIEMIELQTCEINYKVLCQKLFCEWQFVPFPQFQPYQKHPNTLISQSKIIRLEDFGGANFGIPFEEGKARLFIIRAEDLLNVLHAINNNTL